MILKRFNFIVWFFLFLGGFLLDFFVKFFRFLDFMVTVDLLLPVGESALTTMVDNQFLCLIANLSVWLTPLGTPPYIYTIFPFIAWVDLGCNSFYNLNLILIWWYHIWPPQGTPPYIYTIFPFIALVFMWHHTHWWSDLGCNLL